MTPADALFSKRTEVRDLHDRYVNAETSDLLERIERYHGLVLFATNAPSKIDPALLKRVDRVVQRTTLHETSDGEEA